MPEAEGLRKVKEIKESLQYFGIAYMFKFGDDGILIEFDVVDYSVFIGKPFFECLGKGFFIYL